MKDLRCSHCDYDLRDLSIDSKCPECGLAIRESQAIGRAQWSPSIGIRRGLTWLAISMLIGSLLAFGYFWLVVSKTGFVLRGYRAGYAALFLAPPLVAPLVWCFWYRFRGRMGFDGPLVVFPAICGIAGALAIGAWAAINLAHVSRGSTMLLAFVAAGVAVVWIACSDLTS